MNNSSKLPIISDLINQINYTVNKMNKSLIFFSTTHQELRFDIENEAAYYVNVDYFYGLFFERCDIYREFIMQKILLYHMEYEKVKSAITLLHDLRTYKSHTLSKDKSHDKAIIDRVERWYFRLTGRKKLKATDYLVCSNELIDLVKLILDEMLSCIKKIEKDSRKEQMICEMLMVKESYCPDFYIEKQFVETMKSLGLKANAKVLTKKYGKDIRDKMKIYSSLSEKEREKQLRLLLEQILFSKDINICPLAGETIMLEFGLTQGRELGELKRKAIELSREDPYRSQDELLMILREWKMQK